MLEQINLPTDQGDLLLSMLHDNNENNNDNGMVTQMHLRCSLKTTFASSHVWSIIEGSTNALLQIFQRRGTHFLQKNGVKLPERKEQHMIAMQ